MKNPVLYQNAILKKIINENERTEFGKNYFFGSIKNINSFKEACPIQDYDSHFPYIEKMMANASNVLVRGTVDWFAKSSGTTNARSKYIPLTKEYLRKGHLKCAWDAASHIYNENNKAKLFAHKSLIMGGHLERLDFNKNAGDISAIILHHFPKIGRKYYTPSFETALWDDWDEKINRIVQESTKEKVTLLAGVPSWTLVLLDQILSITGAQNITEIWPDLTTYLHGGVSFEPYKSRFKEIIPKSSISFREVYNASEGYFAMQNNRFENGMLILCDHGIYYEFIPKSEIHNESPETITLSELQKDHEYELVITTISGLYRYRMGDIIKIVDISPIKIKHTGRVKESINIYGEELYVCNTDEALRQLCNKYNVFINDYTIAPAVTGNKGRHDWYIEFKNMPPNILKFQEELDTCLRALNSDYDAKRSYDLIMESLNIKTLPSGSFEKYLRKIGKFGRQNKIPRLRDDRNIVDQLE